MARRNYSEKRQKEVIGEALSDMRGLGLIFDFDVDKVLGQSRNQEMIFQRAVMAIYLKHRKGMDTLMIGGILGRDHSTVLHMLKDRKAKNNWDPRYYIFKEAICNGTIKNVDAQFLIANYRKAIRILEEKIERNG